MKATINVEKICEFPTFTRWVNNASTWLGGRRKMGEIIICIDKNGDACNIGEQFMFARDRDLFPVTAYRLIKNTDDEGTENVKENKTSNP